MRVLDDTTFDVAASFALERGEMGYSITSLTFEGDPAPYFVVGTAVINPEEAEPSRGRLIVLQYGDGRLAAVAGAWPRT